MTDSHTLHFMGEVEPEAFRGRIYGRDEWARLRPAFNT